MHSISIYQLQSWLFSKMVQFAATFSVQWEPLTVAKRMCRHNQWCQSLVTVLLRLLWEDICTLTAYCRRRIVKHDSTFQISRHITRSVAVYDCISLALLTIKILDDFGMTYSLLYSTTDIILSLESFTLHPCSSLEVHLWRWRIPGWVCEWFPTCFFCLFLLDPVYVGRWPISSRPPIPTSEYCGALQCQWTNLGGELRCLY